MFLACTSQPMSQLPQWTQVPCCLPKRLIHDFEFLGSVAIGQAVVPVVVERHGEVELAEAVGLADLAGGFLHQFEPLRELAVRQRAGAEHVLDPVIIGLQDVMVDLGRPAALEGLRFRVDRDIGVDQRAAADAGAQRHPHVLEAAQVDPAVEQFRRGLLPHPGVLGPARKLVRRPAPAALEHQHALARARQPARRDRAAKPAADNDGVVGHD